MTFPILWQPWPSTTRVVILSRLALPIAAEPLTLAEGKLRAGLDWPSGDPRDDLMTGFIEAARQQVEQDTGLALPVQTRDLFFDTLPAALPWRDLPAQSLPVNTVTTVTAVDSAGGLTVLDATAYVITMTNSTFTLAVASPPPDTQRWIVRIECGFDPIPPSLVQAVGLLTGHYATVGRDLSIDERRIGLTPLGYTETIRPWIDELLA